MVHNTFTDEKRGKKIKRYTIAMTCERKRQYLFQQKKINTEFQLIANK